nr:unnamed protein product [Callosobruchus chinensis]
MTATRVTSIKYFLFAISNFITYNVPMDCYPLSYESYWCAHGIQYDAVLWRSNEPNEEVPTVG